jgi:hypothetical protein
VSDLGLTPAVFKREMEEAAEKFDVVQSDATSLLLDLDTPEALAQYQRVLPKLLDNYDVVSTQSWLSKSGNTHVRIELGREMTLPERLALQAALGSDGVRELLSLRRFHNGIAEPSRLFRPKVVEPCPDFNI